MWGKVFVFVGGFVAVGLLAAACGSASAAPEVVIAAGQPAAVAPEVSETTTTLAAAEVEAVGPEIQSAVEADEQVAVPESATPEEVAPGGEPEEVAPVARVFEQDEQGRYIVSEDYLSQFHVDVWELFPDALEVTAITYSDDGYELVSEHTREGFPETHVGPREEGDAWLRERGIDPDTVEINWCEPIHIKCWDWD